MLGAPETALKERLGHAVVELIATRAGCQASQPYTDYKSIDVNISPIADDLPMQIDAQIKGQAAGDPWAGLASLTLHIAGLRLPLPSQ